MTKIKQISTLFLGRSLNTIVNILFMPYLARALSYNDYGTYGQVLLSTDIVKTIFSGGLATVIFVFLANTTNQQKKLISSNVFFAFIIGIFSYLILIASSNFIGNLFNNNQIDNYILIYGFSIIFSLMNSSLGSVMIYYKKVKAFTFIITSTNFIKLLLLLISIQVYQSLNLVFVSIVFIQILQFILFYIFLRKRLIINKIVLPSAWLQLKDGFLLSIMSILGFFILYSDGIMVSYLTNVKDYAIYRNGAIEVPLISTLYLSIAQIILPKITQLYSNGNFKEIIRLKNKIVINSALIIFPIAVYFIFFSKEFIVTYVSQKYVDSSIVFTIFTFTLLIRINDYLDVLISAKKNRLIVIIHLSVFILNIILNYILINLIGYKGAAIATVISLYLYSASFVYITSRVLNTNIKSIFNYFEILKILAVSLILIVPFYIVKIYSFNIITIIFVSLLYYPLVYYVFYKLNFFDKIIIDKIFVMFQKIKKIIV